MTAVNKNPPLNKPENILSSWIALEVLQPAVFRRPEELAFNQDRNLIVKLPDKVADWNDVSLKPKKYYNVYYHLILGTLDFKQSMEALSRAYSDKRAERPAAFGDAIIASIVLDDRGRFVWSGQDPVAISSFAWGLNFALQGDLLKLGDWEGASQKVAGKIAEFFDDKRNKNGEPLAIVRSDVDEAYNLLINELKIPPHLGKKSTFAVGEYVYYKGGEPEALLLNSFFIKDLLRTKNLLKNDKLTKNLKAYLQIDKPKKRVDVVRDFDALEEAVKPALTPASKWPSKNPLVLLQQAAVNLALSDLKDGGIMSVNGPPGTGKTTLLRDVYAGVILEKAKAMAAFDDPEQAFEFLGNKMKRGGEEIRLYKLDASLKGHEIIIASSNNKAVENVSAELPNKNAIDIEGDDFNYFRPLSDKLLNCETWGLAAAVLGNFKNVSNFYKTFWKDEDYSVRKYLAHVSGFPQIYEIIDENTKNRIGERPPKIISDSNAPNDKKQALENWKKVKGEFLALYNETIEEINRLEQKRKKKNLFVDSDFYNKSYEEKQLLAPWYSEELANLRNKLFFSSINLCKAFIDAAAKPLRHNLAALMRNIFRVTLDNRRIDLLPDLWSSLFIICPAISTTFASCYRMFNALPNESFGWLFIDEAGQATPQAAVGALRITRRVLAVGDPCQIEPVVGLPDSFTKEVCRKFNVDPDVFNAPEASVQTVADDASHYFAEFPTERASRIVGLPLLVHRRCGSPMFEISNKIAYGNMMTHSKNEAASDIKSYLGTSRWIDVKSASADKWSQEEGEEALALLQKLKENGASENSFYVVSPFRVVASNLRKMIKDRGVYRGWITNVDAWIYERIGTVHTAQGREAEAVILVLGAPDPSQEGARLWAGSKPNLLNVAVTRAKEALYVIGNRDLWKTAGVFNALSRAL